MSRVHHFVSISGGKDSAATACKAKERAERKGYDVRYLWCDTGNEHPITVDYIGTMERQLGIRIERITGYIVPGLMDQAAFDRRRENIQRDWSRERRSIVHDVECRRRRAAIPPLRKGCRHNPERTAALKAWMHRCECPETVWAPLPQDVIDRALEVLSGPTGHPMLDVALLHGLFPSSQRQFCTTETKILPIFHVLASLWRAGDTTVSWVGERAEESKRRAAKPPIERERQEDGWAVTYRPIFRWTAAETFEIARRHGLEPNPLYLNGMGRVGCMPCINVGKNELREIALRFPDQIDRIEAWEAIAKLTSRRAASFGLPPTLLAMADLPGGAAENAPGIREHVEWAKTTRGGRQRDLLFAIEAAEHADGATCSSRYGLCE